MRRNTGPAWTGIAARHGSEYAPVTFTYDPLDNLRTYFTPYRIYTHQYDSATWRLTAIANATPATLYTYAYAGTAGARGNVTTRAKFSLPAVTHSYTFDQANRLRQLAGPTPQTYRYDGLGRRTRLTSGGVPRDQVYSQAGQLLYDKVGTTGSQTRTRYLYLGRHLVAKGVKPPSGAEVITYMHTDGLGSPIAETNTAGAMLTPTRTLHEPYGLVVWGTVNQGPGYTGHVTDVASGLNYMQQRYYDPVAGRFLSVDPVEANASTGASFNRYAYANNNPYSYTDPDGRNAAYIIGGVFVLGTAVNAGAQWLAKGTIDASDALIAGGSAAVVTGIVLANPSLATNPAALAVIGGVVNGGGSVASDVANDVPIDGTKAALSAGTGAVAVPGGASVGNALENALGAKASSIAGEVTGAAITEGVAPAVVGEFGRAAEAIGSAYSSAEQKFGEMVVEDLENQAHGIR